MNKGIKIGGGIFIIIAAIIYWTFQSLEGNEVYYMTVRDLKKADHISSESRLKLGGVVKTGSINKLSPMAVDFRILQDSVWVDVKYEGVIPDMFKDDAEVIVEGRYEDNVFVADNLIAKCASKYETNFEHENGQKDGDSVTGTEV